MLNEILTGQASLEERRVADPYREPSVPDVTRSCVGCRRTFTTKATSDATRCGACYLAQSAPSTDAYAAIARDLERSKANDRFLRGALLVGLSILIAVFRCAMQRSYDEDMRVATQPPAFVFSSDPFAEEVSDFARQMCACGDLACGRDVQARFLNFTRHVSPPTDDAVLQAIAADTERMGTCLGKLEATPRIEITPESP